MINLHSQTLRVHHTDLKNLKTIPTFPTTNRCAASCFEANYVTDARLVVIQISQRLLKHILMLADQKTNVP